MPFPTLRTLVCDLLGCQYPVLLAGMGGVARSELVAAVSEAGGFGFLGMVRESPRLITDEVARVRARTACDFGVSLIPAATKPELLEAEVAACIAARVPVMALFWDLSTDLIKRLRDAGILVLCQVGGPREAEDAQRAGAQIIVAQGVEAGGHVRGTTPLHEVLSQVIASVDLPVIAAGGLIDGKGLAAVLGTGAQGAMFGTAFLATAESFAHDFHKQRIIAAQHGTTILTDTFHVNWPGGAFVRVLPNSTTRGEQGDPFAGKRTAIGTEGDRQIWLFSTDSPLRSMTGDFEAMALYAGEGAGDIEAIVPARERLNAICNEADKLLAGRTRSDTDDKTVTDAASPVCYARTAEDGYMGFATRDELFAFLNEALEIECAAARVAARIMSESNVAAQKAMTLTRYHAAARGRTTLLKWISYLQGDASPHIGPLYERCQAIGDLTERMVVLNRGQGELAHRLREILPRVRDDLMHADLKTLLCSLEGT